MRDSDVAIGGLVLLGIIAALIYFLFPNAISRFLRGPSYTEVVRSVNSEISAFSRETKIISSYFENSWTMKIYKKIDSVIGRGRYEDWIQSVKTEREELIGDTLRNAETERQIADRLALALESRKSIRDKTKGSTFKLGKSPFDSEVESLQAELEKKRGDLLHVLGRFSENRRSLNQKALKEWFNRSLLVGLLTAATMILLCWAILLIPSSSSAKIAHATKLRGLSPLSFASKAGRQSGLIKALESPVLADSAFHFALEPELGPIPQPIAKAFGELPQTNAALKLASILGGYPETPASRSHHLSDPGGLIIHTAKVLRHSEPLIPMLPQPKIGPVVILAHDIGKVLTLSNQNEGRPHDIPSADILASLGELRAEFDEITARSMILAIRHQHSKSEVPLNAPPLTQTILQFIKKADLAASAEESREAAERMRELVPRVIDVFPYIIPELNVNGCMGGKAEGYLSDGYLFLFKEPVKEKLLSHLDTQNAPVFKGQDPVWNEMALALAGAGLITTKVATKEAGKKSCLFTIRTSQEQEKAIAIPASNVAPQLIEGWLQANIPKIEVI